MYRAVRGLYQCDAVYGCVHGWRLFGRTILGRAASGDGFSGLGYTLESLRQTKNVRVLVLLASERHSFCVMY